MRATLLRDDTVLMSIRFLDELLREYADCKFAVRLWDGTVRGTVYLGTQEPRCSEENVS